MLAFLHSPFRMGGSAVSSTTQWPLALRSEYPFRLQGSEMLQYIHANYAEAFIHLYIIIQHKAKVTTEIISIMDGLPEHAASVILRNILEPLENYAGQIIHDNKTKVTVVVA
jgi:hypothetical protein